MRKCVLFFLVSTALSAPAFGGGSEEISAVDGNDDYGWIMDVSDDDILPGVNPLKVTGDIWAAGSSTVFPLSERMIERFKDEGYGGNITLDSIGSGAGFERWAVAAETDIANASRPIKDKEIEAA